MPDLPLPLHLSVHLVGLAVTGALAVDGWRHRDQSGFGWLSMVLAGVLLGASHLLLGGLLWSSGSGPLLLRAAAYASVAVAAVGTPVAAVVVAAPVGVRVLTGVVAAMAALSARGGVLGRGRDVAPLTVGILLWGGADLASGWIPWIGAVLSLAGSLAVMVWLRDRSDGSLATRFTVGAGGVVLLVVLVLASGAGYVFDRDLVNDRLTRLDQAVTAQVARLEVDPLDELAGAVDIVSASVASRLAAGTADDDFAATVQRVAQGDPDLVVLLDASGRVVGSYDRRQDGAVGVAETTLAGSPVVTAAFARRQPVAGLVSLEFEESASDAGELIAVAADVLYAEATRRDVVSGVFMIARRLTTAEVVARVAADTGADAALIVGGRVAAASTTLDPVREAALAEVGSRSGARLEQIDGQGQFLAVGELRDAALTQLGALVLFEDAAVIADLENVVVRTLFLAAAIGGLLAAAMVNVLSRRTTTPLRALAVAAGLVADGDLDIDIPPASTDEVGRLGLAFGEMTTSLKRRNADLQTAAVEQRELREELEQVTSAMGEALLAVDDRGAVVLANPAATQLLGVDQSELLGAALDNLLVGSDERGLPLADVLGGPSSVQSATARGELRPEGRGVVAVAATAEPLLGPDGESRGRVFVLRDVSIEAQVDKMKTEFMSNISHELRTPLTPIRAYAQLLAQRPDLDSERVQSFGESIVEAARRLERVIGMLVDFAALSAGPMNVDIQPIDVGAHVEAARARWAKLRPDRTVNRRLRRGLPSVMADPDMLDRVLDEFLDNALKFSTDDVIIVASSERGMVTLGVKDHGAGMDQSTIDSLRDDFHQADGSATRAVGGLGLGLAIVGRIAEQLGGDVEATSEPGRMTHVAIRLPAAQSNPR